MKKLVTIKFVSLALIGGGFVSLPSLTSCGNGEGNKPDSNKENLPDFTMGMANQFGDLLVGYGAISIKLTTDFMPPDDYTGHVDYAIQQNVTGNKLSIDGDTLTLQTGLTIGDYSFILYAKASSDEKYNSKNSSNYSATIHVDYNEHNRIENCNIAALIDDMTITAFACLNAWPPDVQINKGITLVGELSSMYTGLSWEQAMNKIDIIVWKWKVESTQAEIVESYANCNFTPPYDDQTIATITMPNGGIHVASNEFIGFFFSNLTGLQRNTVGARMHNGNATAYGIDVSTGMVVGTASPGILGAQWGMSWYYDDYS